MKKVSYLTLLALLTACAGEKADPYSCVGSGRGCHPYDPNNPSVPYANAATNSNKKISSIVSNNYTQVNKFIAYRLGGYATNDSPVSSNMDVADLALWLTSGDRTAAEIEAKFDADKNMLRRAMYVVNKSLGSCINSGLASTASKCFIDWRTANSDAFAKAGNDLLENAELLIIQNADFAATNGTQLKFTIDGGTNSTGTGRIVSVQVVDNMGTKNFDRVGDTNTFVNGDSTLSYNSVGKELGLSYSDFGIYNIVNSIAPNDTHNTPFAGGYDSKKIDTVNIASDMTFSGRAVGTVTSTKSGATESINLTGGNATLNFTQNDGTSSLKANFDNWYDVAVTKGTSNTNIEFNNYKQNADGHDMELITASGADGVIKGNGANMDVTYYGSRPENGIPTEATGLVQFKDCGGAPCDGIVPEVNLDMAFGVKR